MKATAERTPVELSGRHLVAGEVRAILARRKINSNTLPLIAAAQARLPQVMVPVRTPRRKAA